MIGRCELGTKDGGVCLGRVEGDDPRTCTHKDNHFLHCCDKVFGNDHEAAQVHYNENHAS